MPPEAAADATKSILDVGVVGAVCILLLLACVFLANKLFKAQDQMLAEREKRVTEFRDFFTAQSEAIRRSLESATEASNTTLEALRDRRRD